MAKKKTRKQNGRELYVRTTTTPGVYLVLLNRMPDRFFFFGVAFTLQLNA